MKAKETVYQPDLFDDRVVVAPTTTKQAEPEPMLCCGEWVQPWAHCRHCGTRND